MILYSYCIYNKMKAVLIFCLLYQVYATDPFSNLVDKIKNVTDITDMIMRDLSKNISTNDNSGPIGNFGNINLQRDFEGIAKNNDNDNNNDDDNNLNDLDLINSHNSNIIYIKIYNIRNRNYNNNFN